MMNLWKKSVVAMALCLLAVACAKSSDGGSSVSEPAKPTAPTAETPAPAQPENLGRANRDKNHNHYSGSADDYLREYAQVQMAQVADPEQRARNLKLASSVLSASLKIDYNRTGDVVLSVTLGSSDLNKKIHLLGGTLSSQRQTKLTTSQKNSGVSGVLRCMDQVVGATYTCETALVSLKVQKADMKIIFRRTGVKLDAQFPKAVCKSHDCEQMFSLFRQTELGVSDRNTIRQAKLESFEVIQGRSEFRLIVITNKNEVITVGGPLLNPLNGAVTNIPADRTLKIEDLVDLRTLQNHRDRMQKSMSDVRIVGNNGRGIIELQVKMKMLEDGAQDQFLLTLIRQTRELEPLVEKLNDK